MTMKSAVPSASISGGNVFSTLGKAELRPFFLIGYVIAFGG